MSTIAMLLLLLTGGVAYGQSAIALTATHAVVVALDGWQTAQPGTEVTSAWLYGTHPGEHKAKLALILAGEVASAATLAHYMRHSHVAMIRRLWWVPQIASTAGHLNGIRYNFRHWNGGF